MPNRDFFAFCTSLKPIELRTIGELSWVRHIAEGEVLYSPGEPGNALFIVNRGTLEVHPPKGRKNAKVTLVSRGDLVGDVEAFADIKRSQLVRAREESSLQCFPRTNFPQLLRLVPGFFRHICEQMALSLLNEREIAAEQNQTLELSGRISNFDLTTIHQTIMSSGQTGELEIKDEHGQPIGAFYFEVGRLSAAKFQHLTGEDAFWQLFLCDQLSGTFSFSVGEPRKGDWIESAKIEKNSDLLIVACQYRDELDALKKGMPNLSEELSVSRTDLHWNGGAPEALQPLAKQVWDLLMRSPKTIGDLYRQCSVCELKLYQVVAELLYSEQIRFRSMEGRQSKDIPELAELPRA